MASTIAATTLLGSTITACAYEPEEILRFSHNKFSINNLTLQATPIDYETSKYPQIDLGDYYLHSKLYHDNISERNCILTLNYTNVPKNLYSSGNILLGAKIYEYNMEENCNSMACIKLNDIDIKNTYAATYEVGISKCTQHKDFIKNEYFKKYEYNAIARLEPSYSVFGSSDVEIKLYHLYDCESDKYTICGEFKVPDELLLDGFEVVLDAAPNVDRSVSGRRSSGIRTAKFAGEADVQSYTGVNPFSDDEISSQGEFTLAMSDEPFANRYFDFEYDVFFNDIKVADNIKISDPIYWDDNR